MANYKKLLEQNPAYSTIVGYIETKHAHEIMSFYLNLNMIQQGKLAEEFLDIAEYNDFFLASAKNYLRSCPPNAILVTWGDSDYYPLCYVQAKLGFRKDVTILNKSLMALARHINYTSNTLLPKENRVQISMNLDLYKGWLNDYLYVTKDRTEFDYSDFTQKMNENPAQYKYRNLGDRPIHKLPSSSMLLGKDDQLLLKIANSYIIKDEFFLFDLINTNWQKRPICFTSGVPIHRIAYLSNYLVQRGEVYELTKETANAENYQNQPFNVKISEALVLKEFEFEPYTLEQSSSTEYLSQNMHYSTLFSDLIEYHIEEGNPTIIKNILDKMYEKLPPAITVLKSSHLQIAQYYSELNPTHKRIKEYIEAYANQLQMGIDKWEESDKIARMHLTTNARDFKSLAKLLIESCRMHRLEKLRVKYKEQFAKYLPRN
ncbi:MAG: hypothetical protein GY810_05050 [Aureispira sp.]|nr:hypothetical protein [Aureispira sp.]